MIQEQLVSRGIEDQRVLDAFYKVERHRFVSEELRINAYADFPLPIEKGQTISQPYIVALMLQALELKGDEKVLEIGTGSGYQTALLAELTKEVYTIERFKTLAEKAQKRLNELKYANVQIRAGDGTLGWPKEAPFDRTIISAASPGIPPPLVEQLKDGGKLILPLGEAWSQVLTLAEKNKGRLKTFSFGGCVFVPLAGKYSR